MKRRDLLAGLLPVAVAPLARAQQAGKMYRIAIFHPTQPVLYLSEQGGLPWWRALHEELRRLGYEEGRNLTVERYSGGGQPETYVPLLKQIVASRPDLIFPFYTSRRDRAEFAPGPVPVVVLTDDPIAAGLTTSLSRPSTNVTGVVVDAGGPELRGKRLQLLRELRHGLTHIAILASRDFDYIVLPRWAETARADSIRVSCLCVAGAQEAAHRQAFAELDHDRPDAIILHEYPASFTFRELIVDLVNTARIPALYPQRPYVEAGGLISYGHDPVELFRHLARQMDMILRGRPVSEVPFYQLTEWDLAINLRTAKALGLEIPPSILARADEVIE
jgi:putative ABC transport system substrate-binding protein